MNIKIKIPVTFAPINELNSWTQPINYSDGPQHRPGALRSQKRTGLVPHIKNHAPAQVKYAHS
ncbi:MAG TPA: hypothetical protein VFF11_12485 [Candidatus Binatia bacterium]|nr:hypothetical protein [Candidatus Binatia bacterium]